MDRTKILVVDDEEDLCEILQFNLESEGYAVDIANSAEQALKILSDDHRLILLDVMMEGMSGFKMAEKVRRDRKRHAHRIQYRRRRLYCQTFFDQRGKCQNKSHTETNGGYRNCLQPGNRDRRPVYKHKH